MTYSQYPYDIYNPTYVNPNYLQQVEAQRQNMEMQQKHLWQQKNISDMVKAISDYCKAARQIDPAYQQEAFNACLAEIARQIQIDQQVQGGNTK